MTVCVRERTCRSVELNSNLNLRLTKARENRVLKENQWDCNWQMEEVLQILEKDKKKKNFTSSEARTRAMSSIRQEGEDIDSDSENENK